MQGNMIAKFIPVFGLILFIRYTITCVNLVSL